MSDISGNGLSFKSTMDNEQMNAAIEETLRRVQGFSDATVAGGAAIDAAFDGTANSIRQALSQIGDACASHEAEIAQLQAKYDTLGAKIGKALSEGRDDEVRALQDEQAAIKGSITMHEKMLRDYRRASDELETYATHIEQSSNEAVKAGEKHTTLRTKIRELREEMIAMEMAGQRGTAEYRALQDEVGRLTDAYSDATAQANILAHDQRGMQGLISAFSGVSGAASAAQGALSLFGTENENIQKVMLKVQSLMAITVGLQQVQQTLNKDSAFQLVTLNGLKDIWAKMVAAATGAEMAETQATVAETAAETANATATGAATAAKTAKTAASKGAAVASGVEATAQAAETGAAVAGTAANLTLAGAFRAVGVAIKSIPVFGWIAAGIGALVGAISLFSKKAREAKKAQEEFSKSMIENAYKPIGRVQALSAAWNELGDNLEAKQKFIEQNKKAFDELGVAVNGVTDAENLLVANTQAFIDAQIAKARSMVYFDQAQAKVKQLMELEQKYNSMPDKVTKDVYRGGMNGGYVTSYEVDNSAKAKVKKQMEELRAEITTGYSNAANAESEGLDLLKKAGIDAANSYADGTVGAIEQAIAKKQAALKLLTNAADYKAGMKELEDLQKQLSAITGAPKTSGSSKDPFKEKLDKMRSEYQRFTKWVNSGDAILVKAANQEFAGLLKEGSTYIDYLKRQRDLILEVDVANRTKAQNNQLRTLNDAIAEETKKTVLESFNTELNDALSNAKTAIEMLNIIEQRRKELANDGTDVDNEKGEALDNAEKSAKEKLAQDTAALLEEYAGYAAQRKAIDEKYFADLEILNKARLAAQTDDERKAIDDAIANRQRQYQQDTKGSGNADYDAMLSEYGSFEQRKQAIIDEYDEKRRIATEQGNTAMIEKLNEAQAKAISALATSELTGSEIWTNLFSNLDELTASEIETLIQEIESNFEELSGVFNPIDLQQVREKLNEARMVLMQDNPFKQLGASLKAIFKDAGDDSKDSADQIKKNWKKLGESTEASFQFVLDAVNSCDFLKDAIGDVGSTAISSMASVAATSIAVATAIKTAEKSSVILAIIQAALVVVQAVVNVVKSIVGNQDAKLEKQIEKWKGAVDDLKNAYAQLSWEIDKALGGQVYKTQQAAIKNMQQQQAYLEKMWKAEQDKKKTDSDKVRDYKEQYAELERQIADMYEEIANDIVQTDAKGFAEELGDALAEAFEKGEDASKAFEETVNDVLKNAIINQLKKNFLEQQLQGALDQLQRSMGYWNGDEFVFDDLTDYEIEQFKNKVAAAKNGYMQAMEVYKDLFKDLTGEEETEDSLSVAVKGVTEETANIVAGQLNAIRVNQVEAVEVMRQQLMSLNQIANNTSYNYHLAKLDRVVSLLESMGADGTMRAQGLS